MTIAEWMTFAAVLTYLLTLAPVKAFGHQSFDNANPRDPAFYTSGIRSRALGAHYNGIEVFPFFAAAVLLAEFRGAPQAWIDLLAVSFIAIRLAYVGAYVGNLPTMRTVLWNTGFVTNVAIFFMPWWTK
ncbi:MAG: MAPEG family protein [Pseudolabrys sp.]